MVAEYTALGARAVHPIYNAVDPGEYYPVPPDPSPEYACDLLLLANRMPDREARIWDLFAGAATLAPAARFVLGGAGWEGAPFPPNVRWIGHVPTGEHARRNCSARLVLNVNRAAMADYGYSPPTRIFEAAGNGACLITDRWPGIADFLAPDREILVADGAADIARYLRDISWTRRGLSGRGRAPASCATTPTPGGPGKWTGFCAGPGMNFLFSACRSPRRGATATPRLSRPAAGAGGARPPLRLPGTVGE